MLIKLWRTPFSNQFLHLLLLLPLPLYPNHLHAHHLPLFLHHLHSPYLLPLPYKTTPILLWVSQLNVLKILVYMTSKTSPIRPHPFFSKTTPTLIHLILSGQCITTPPQSMKPHLLILVLYYVYYVHVNNTVY